ncbi:MAG: DUF6198 family protein [Planctomycetaceae bacterium]|nr:DUF6198 family protein [Planctomycetaceae bacterium]
MSDSVERRKLNMCLRYVLCFVGITTMALGVALTTKANLGTTPISALPYVASAFTSMSIGVWTGLFNVLLVVAQVLVMGKRFPKLQYLQIPVSCLFGLFIDVWMSCLPEFATHSVAMQIAVLCAGTVTLAFGVFLEVSAGVVVMAGEGAVKVMTIVSRREFGPLKVVFDVTLVLTAVLLSLYMFEELKGIGIGTIVSAACVGLLVKMFHSARRRVAG